MRTSRKLSIAVAAACIGGLLWYGTGDDPTPPAPAAPREQRAAEAHAAQADREAEREQLVRIDATTATAVEPWLAHPYELELEVTVLDALGLPIAGFSPRISPPAGALVHASEASDAHGRLVLRVPSRTPSARVEVLDDRRHRRVVTLRHGARARITMLQPSSTATASLSGSFGIRYGADSATILGVGPAQWRSSSPEQPLHPHAMFCEAGVVVVEPSPPTSEEGASAVSALSFDASVGLSFTDLGVMLLDDFPASVVAGGAAIEGVVYLEDGTPAAEVPVVVLGDGPQPLHRAATDEQGRYRVEGLQPGAFVVRAGGTDAGLGTTPAQLAADTTQVDVYLRREACVRGRVLDERGAPIAGAELDWHAADGRWADRAQTDERGAFVFANLPRTNGDVTVWSPRSGRVFPIAFERGVLPDVGEVLITAADGEGSKLSLEPRAADGLDLRDLRVRVLHVESGLSRGISVPKVTQTRVAGDGTTRADHVDAPESPWTIAHLPRGDYEVEVWLPGAGRLHCGRHHVDGRDDCALGLVALRAPGRVVFDVPADWRAPDGFAVEFTELRPSFDVRVDSIPGLDRELLLPAGDYSLAVRDARGGARFARFSVASGALVRLPIAW